jgi:hypothetical protein
LSAFTKQAGQAGTGLDGAGGDGAAPKLVPDRATSPPVGFEAIEHEDAKPLADEGGLSVEKRPSTSKRRSTSGGWGGWWAGKKEKEVVKEKAVGIKEGVDESGDTEKGSGVKSD